MANLFVHNFRVSGSFDSARITDLRNRLAVVQGVGAISFNRRRMEVEITSGKGVQASAIRNSLVDMEVEISLFTTKIVAIPAGARNDEPEEVSWTVPPSRAAVVSGTETPSRQSRPSRHMRPSPASTATLIPASLASLAALSSAASFATPASASSSPMTSGIPAPGEIPAEFQGPVASEIHVGPVTPSAG